MIAKLACLISLPFLLAHELGHYLPAKLLGLNPSFISLDAIEHDRRGPVADLVVALGPALLGWLAFGLWLGREWLAGRSLFSLSAVAGMLLFWQLACGDDYRFVWRTLTGNPRRNGRD